MTHDVSQGLKDFVNYETSESSTGRQLYDHPQSSKIARGGAVDEMNMQRDRRP